MISLYIRILSLVTSDEIIVAVLLILHQAVKYIRVNAEGYILYVNTAFIHLYSGPFFYKTLR